MANETADGQEKTETPTAKKLEKARTEGQVPRSRELNGFLVLITGALCFMYFGHVLLYFAIETAERFFRVDRQLLQSPLAIANLVESTAYRFLRTMLFFLSAIVAVSIASPKLMGGWNFSMKAVAPKLSKLNPLRGLKRMFSKNSLLEVVKATGKFFLVAPAAVFSVLWFAPTLERMPWMPVNRAMAEAIEVLMLTFLIISAALIIIVLIDVPFQLWNNNEQLKMTKEEVKQEHKNTEGSPEVKKRIKQAQFEMAFKRMMDDVPKADVVITNPTHYAVALRYDQSRDEAPILVAKGKNLMAFKIKEIAQEHGILVMESPPLARSIFHTTKVDQEIPAGLYMAVARVLAYVHQLRSHKAGRSRRPIKPTDLKVPPELQFD